MVQPAERMTARLTVHIYPSVKTRLDRVVDASPFDLPDWIRHFIDETLVRTGTGRGGRERYSRGGNQ